MNIQETEEIRSIIDNYRSIHQELSFYEKNLEDMVSGIEEKTEERISLIGSKIKEGILKLEQENYFFLFKKNTDLENLI